MNTLELTDAEVQYLFGIVMAEYGSTAENASVAKKLTEILKERRNRFRRKNFEKVAVVAEHIELLPFKENEEEKF